MRCRDVRAFDSRCRAAAAALLLLTMASASALAQQPSPEQASAIRQSCRGDYQANCAGVPTGGSAALACLKQHAASLSAPCQHALGAVATGATAPPTPPAAGVAPPPAAVATAATESPDTWPHRMHVERGEALIYQPQVIAWPERRVLNTRIAVAVTPSGASNAVLGSIEVSFATHTDLATRRVTLTHAQLLKSHFPAADTAQAQRFDAAIASMLASLPPKRVPLDMVLLSLRGNSESAPAVALHNEPPQIFVSQRPASLLVFDGDPVMAPVAGTSLTIAVNTNWDVFVDGNTHTWYWLNDGAWLRAADFRGPWEPAGSLPATFSALPSDANFAEVRKNLPGRRLSAAQMPQVFVASRPAEVIVIDGAPRYVAIAGTRLQYVANSDAALFRDSGDGLTYFLVSGRWFSAPSLDGPWRFATDSLPPDFQRIPPAGPRGFVLVSVPGTVQAQEALIQAQIPQQATLDKASAKVEVVYAGEPKFEPIAGTPMAYAVNTSFDVVRVDSSYYACYQGAWFTAPTPSGAWLLAPSVPQVIYTIPPANPLYPCTYVRVYAATPTSVTYGYTAGYTMGFISAGVIVYGTGYYYPPYIWPAPMPVFYPWPVTYRGATYYNPATGAWAHGGAIYGPFYGARGGSAYNPATGAYARGGSVYGPYGGAGAFSAYNPSTGGYAHGSAVWGPDGAAGNASWYNPRTGISGSTQQNANAYGHWGSSTISGPNQTVHTQSQGNARGSTGSFSSSTGAEGAGVHGAGGNNAGAVKTAGGSVYAGADGNVYKKTSDGWQKYSNGSWSPVQKPNPPQNRPANLPQRAPTEGQAGRFSQLEQDRQARLGGFERQQQRMREPRGGFGGGEFRR